MGVRESGLHFRFRDGVEWALLDGRRHMHRRRIAIINESSAFENGHSRRARYDPWLEPSTQGRQSVGSRGTVGQMPWHRATVLGIVVPPRPQRWTHDRQKAEIAARLVAGAARA